MQRAVKPKAGRGNAGHDRLIIPADVAPVFHHPRLGAGLLPEIAEVGNFQLVQKPVVFGRQRRQAGDRRGSCADCWPIDCWLESRTGMSLVKDRHPPAPSIWRINSRRENSLDRTSGIRVLRSILNEVASRRD